jgi:putative transposase
LQQEDFMTSRQRREITPEFKREAAGLLASSGRTIRRIAGELDLGLSTLNSWNREQRDTEPVTAPNPDMAKELARLCKENEILCYDNAMVETVFKTIKTELIWRASFETRADTTFALGQCIDGFYNPRRRHSALGYKSPVTFEAKMAEVN